MKSEPATGLKNLLNGQDYTPTLQLTFTGVCSAHVCPDEDVKPCTVAANHFLWRPRVHRDVHMSAQVKWLLNAWWDFKIFRFCSNAIRLGRVLADDAHAVPISDRFCGTHCVESDKERRMALIESGPSFERWRSRRLVDCVTTAATKHAHAQIEFIDRGFTLLSSRELKYTWFDGFNVLLLLPNYHWQYWKIKIVDKIFDSTINSR